MAPRRDPLSPQEVKAWVVKTCERQGVDPKITDWQVLRRVAEILGSSHPPRRRKPRRIEEVPAPDGRSDENRVQDGGNDRLLA